MSFYTNTYCVCLGKTSMKILLAVFETRAAESLQVFGRDLSGHYTLKYYYIETPTHNVHTHYTHSHWYERASYRGGG